MSLLGGLAAESALLVFSPPSIHSSIFPATLRTSSILRINSYHKSAHKETQQESTVFIFKPALSISIKRLQSSFAFLKGINSA